MYSVRLLKQTSLPGSSLDIASFFRHNLRITLKTIFCVHKRIVYPNDFRTTFAAVLILNQWLRKFPLSIERSYFY